MSTVSFGNIVHRRFRLCRLFYLFFIFFHIQFQVFLPGFPVLTFQSWFDLFSSLGKERFFFSRHFSPH